MSEKTMTDEPSWDTPLTVTLTPSAILNTVFASAHSVHIGRESCIDDALIIAETTIVGDLSGNHCRLAQLEYVDREMADETWHEWTVELQIDHVYVIAHWQTRVTGSPTDWDWCAAEADNAFINACTLLGKRVRRGLVVDELPHIPRTSRPHH
jgi:hypothetical protein